MYIDRWMDKEVMIHIYIYTMEYYSAINGHILFSPDEPIRKRKTNTIY